jgi:Zn-dependent protease
MKGAWKITTVKGIGVFIHWSFLALPVLVVFTNMSAGAGIVNTLSELILLLAVFFCVVLHELGHALTAARYGVKTRDIILLPVGGVARLERMPDKPLQEFWVALAGPMVNVIIVLLLALIMLAGKGLPLGIDFTDPSANGFVENLAVINISLVLFNLIPAFPMDGGRIFRSLLATRIGKSKATRIAAALGQIMALGFILAGLFYNPVLILIGVFVFFGAKQEAEALTQHILLDKVPVADLMITNWVLLSPSATLGDAARELIKGHSSDFFIGAENHVDAVLDRDMLIQALISAGESAPALHFAKACTIRLVESDNAETAWERMSNTGLSALPVYRNEKLAGILTRENIREYLLIRVAGERYSSLHLIKNNP